VPLESRPLQSAVDLARTGNLAESEKLCRELLGEPGSKNGAMHLLGVIRNIQSRHAEAVGFLRDAIAEQPGIAKFHSNLGNALRGLGRLDEAEGAYRQALALDPRFGDAHANLAHLLQATWRRDEAIEEYRRALEVNPQDTTSLTGLAFLLQSANRLAEAEEFAAAGLELEPKSHELNLAMAICESRAGRTEQALERFETIRPAALKPWMAAGLHYERGLLYDRLDWTTSAWADFAAANRLQAQDARRRGVDKARHLAELERAAQVEIEGAAKNPVPAGGPAAPVFLVGFPRSGTTLLDQILDRHPGIQTLEEKPIVRILREDMENLVRGEPGGLAALSPAQLARLRDLYFEHAAEYVELKPGNLLVDKFPLNIERIPYILRIFPDARFILALRHPCDCVLSCYMHLFDPNDAMANFHSLADAATLYAKVMGLWRRWDELVNLPHRRVYYERLVHDLPGEIKPLLEFLGLDWHDGMARPDQHALRRGHIDTPSHSRPVQPVYQRAAGRWRRYRPYFGDAMRTLQPHIEYFGYAD
jgi:tetratricopeptide (TPR) repeat protein